MKSTTNFKSGLLLLFGLAAAACSDPIVPEAEPAALPLPDAAQELRIDPTVRELSEADATVVAERFARQWADGGKHAVATRSGSLETIADTDGAPFAYVVNFDGGGFCIVGATKENYPVLAYDERNALTIEGNGSGIADWIDYTVEAAKYRTAEEAAAIARQWADYEALPATQASYYNDPARYAVFNDMINSFDPMTSAAFPLQSLLDNPSSGHVPDDILRNARILADQKECPYQYFIIERVNRSVTTGPYITTSWGQQDYNSLIIANYGNYPTGCPAVAAGQIMNYYRYPEKYWNGQSSLDQLIYDLGISFHISYTTAMSGATLDNIVLGLQSDFNYTATSEPYYSFKMQAYITTHKKPTLIAGWWSTQAPGHIWICDGYKNIVNTEYRMYYQIAQNGGWVYETNGIYYVSNSVGTVTVVPGEYLHMNWGEAGHGDGWYKLGDMKYTNINNQTLDFKINPHMITLSPNK